MQVRNLVFLLKVDIYTTPGFKTSEGVLFLCFHERVFYYLLLVVLSKKFFFINKLVTGTLTKEILLTQVLFSGRFRLITADFTRKFEHDYQGTILYITVTVKITSYS